MKSWWFNVVGLGMMLFSSSVGAVEIIAHRGASAAAPENTVAAEQLAWTMDSDCVEVDVHLTLDDRVVVIHDGTTKRTAGVNLEVRQATAEALRALDVGSFKGEKYRGEKIPFLEEIVEAVPPGKNLYIEIKCGPEVLPWVREIIDRSGKRSQMVIIGFNLETMAQSKKLMPDRPTYWLRGTVKDKETGRMVPHDPEWIHLAKERRLDGLNVHFGGVTQDFCEAVRASGLGMYVWTVDDPAEAKRLHGLDVDGITTNKPDLLRRELHLAGH